MKADRHVAAAYDSTSAAWERGPHRVYDVLAETLVAAADPSVRGRTVLDLGAGTGAATRAVQRAGGRAIGVDAAAGPLLVGRERRPPAVVADGYALPFADGALGGVLAAFVLNHLTRPGDALAEAARVCRPGSPIVASVYAEDDDHPVKAVVEEVLRGSGWVSPEWYTTMRRDAAPLLATSTAALRVAESVGLQAQAQHLRIGIPGLSAGDLVDWRLGMAHSAPFVADLAPPAAAAVRRSCLERLGSDPPALVRSIIVVTAVA